MLKLIRYIRKWIRFRWYYYVKIFRPSHIKIKGCIYFDVFSFIDFTSSSEMTIDDNVKLVNSRIYLDDSICHIGANSIVTQSVLYLKQSELRIGEHSIFRKINFSLFDKSTFKSGAHTMMDGSKHQFSGFTSYNSKIDWGKNMNHYAHSKCENAIWTAGSNIFINWGTQVRCETSLTMGNNILISYDCLIFDTNTHSLDGSDRRKEIEQGFPNSSIQFEEDKQKIKKMPIKMGDDVWIGTRSMIFKGTCLGNEVIVGAGSVISGLNVPNGGKVVGNPASIK